MSQHPSLRVDSVGAKHRNVLKRYERIKKMQADSKWGDRASALNLPKFKSIKVKVKKAKEAAPAEGAAAPGAAPAAAAPAAKAEKSKK
ncbi:MAG: small basic protein [Candidatus Omnitrophota bacterium]|jgi:small basic protein (TIGR04137 family)